MARPVTQLHEVGTHVRVGGHAAIGVEARRGHVGSSLSLSLSLSDFAVGTQHAVQGGARQRGCSPLWMSKTRP